MNADNSSKVDLEVRWGECDAAGIVYHPVYIDWFSVARMGFLKSFGVTYMEAFHDRGVVLVVLDVACNYRKTLRAEDKVTVHARLRHVSRTRMGFSYEVVDELGNICAAGKTEHAFVDLAQKPVNVAKRSPELWQLLQQLPVSGEAD